MQRRKETMVENELKAFNDNQSILILIYCGQFLDLDQN